MRVFVTGATGFIGSAVVRELLDAGYNVLGLARSDKAAASLESIGAEVIRGSLEDPGSLREGATSADGVIHTAFNHDFTRFAESCELDRQAIATIGGALRGSNRLLLVSHGLALLTPGRTAAEDDVPPAVSSAYPRASEAAAAELVANGTHASVVRLPSSVHGAGDHAFVPFLIDVARRTSVSAYVSDGMCRWSAVHRLDAAHLFRLALEAGASNARYHAVGDEGVPFRDIAETIGRRLNVPTVSKTPTEAAAHFGWFAPFAAMDTRASSQRTRAVLGWQPHQPGLLADIDAGYYFELPSSDKRVLGHA